MERRYLHRILIVALTSSLFFGLVLARLYYLQWVCHDDYKRRAAGQHTKSVVITPQRGSIYSRRGEVLASSEVRETAYLAVAALRDDAEQRRRLAHELAQRLDMTLDDAYTKLHSSRREVVLARQLPREKVLELTALANEMDLPPLTLYFAKEGKRNYPKGELAAHVIGYTQPDDYGDNIGLAGLELFYDDQIAGSSDKERVQRTVSGLKLSPMEDEALLKATGNDVFLTIDAAIQAYAEEALNEQVEKNEATGGVCVVMEVGTGAILAMASSPTFDIENRGAVPAANRTNRCVVHAIPPGSAMKVFVTTALLEHNRLSPYEWIDCHHGTIYYRGRSKPIRDSHSMGVVQVHEAFAESSNVAYTQLGQRLNRTEFYDSLRRFGFGSATGIDLPGEASGIVHPVKDWSGVSIISLSIGYELTVTPVQVAAAMAAIANRGRYVAPRLLSEVRSPTGELVYRASPKVVREVCSPQTSEIVLRMMEEVVTEGTGKQAAVEGYRVGGKTGTTRKHQRLEDGRAGYYASFLGVLPVESPRLVIYVWVEDPNVKWGGSVAAPVFQKVASHAVRILGIKPSEAAPRIEPADAPARLMAGGDDMALPVGVIGAVAASDGREGRMPNLTGMSLREAVEALNRLRIEAELVGWGTVVRQQPEPGATIRPGVRGLVVLQPESEIAEGREG